MALLSSSYGGEVFNAFSSSSSDMDVDLDDFSSSSDNTNNNNNIPGVPEQLTRVLFWSGSNQSITHWRRVLTDFVEPNHPWLLAGHALSSAQPLPPRVAAALRNHYLLSSALAGITQLLVIYTATPRNQDTLDMRISVLTTLFTDLSHHISRTLGTHRIPAASAGCIVYLLFAWVLPFLVRSRSTSLLKGALDILRATYVAYDQSNSDTASNWGIPPPPDSYGWSISEYVYTQRVFVMQRLGHWAASAALPSLAEAEALDEMMSGVLAHGQGVSDITALRFPMKIDPMFQLFLASPQRAPMLDFPTYESRLQLSDEATASQFLRGGRLDVSAARKFLIDTGDMQDRVASSKEAVRAHGGASPDKLPLAFMPPCAAATLWKTTPRHMGGAHDGSSTLNNDDRYLMASFMGDIGGFDIEDMDRFFRDRLSIASDTQNFSERHSHAMTQVRRHREITTRRQRNGEWGYWTPKCETMRETATMPERRTFRCVFAQPDMAELDDLLEWMQVPDAERQLTLCHARDGHAGTACATVFQALNPNAAPRNYPITHPHFYTHQAAAAAGAPSQ